ncbi:MAG: homocysteine S-methyltransferase family protein [Phycisphaerae bacterium]|nr:homocysteine S-methyltransferase family protein [Phycisphaerae bacterium]MDD5381820.1 homocysteine S-methyltransferase family protein [Phycisphaerae bacterium]
MAKISLRERISKGVFLLDGAMGTQLIARGIELGRCYDCLNIEQPDAILEIHRAYLEAGSDAVLTNTFGANRFTLARHGFSDKVRQINIAGAQIAREAAGEDKYVLGDIGPSGDFLKPLGNLEPGGLREAIFEQAKALSEGGVDGFIIETETALDEATITVEAVKQVSGDLPVFVSFAFDWVAGDFKTMMGVDVKSAITKMVSLGVDAVGFNCGTVSLDEYVELAKKFVSTVKTLNKKVLVFAEPNAGKPELVDGRAVYRVTPEDFAAAVEKIHSAGVNIIGGCCGTTPEHIRALAEILKK